MTYRVEITDLAAAEAEEAYLWILDRSIGPLLVHESLRVRIGHLEVDRGMDSDPLRQSAHPNRRVKAEPRRRRVGEAPTRTVRTAEDRPPSPHRVTPVRESTAHQRCRRSGPSSCTDRKVPRRSASAVADRPGPPPGSAIARGAHLSCPDAGGAGRVKRAATPRGRASGSGRGNGRARFRERRLDGPVPRIGCAAVVRGQRCTRPRPSDRTGFSRASSP